MAEAMRKRLAFLGILLLVLGLLGCSPRSPPGQNIIAVKPGQSIQAVLDAAPPNSIILIPKGIWTENVRVEKPVTLRGEGKERTVLQAGVAGPPVLWAGKEAEITVENLTIRGGRGGYVHRDLSSAGIFLAEKATLTARSIRIVQNAASGVFAKDQATLVLENAEITENARYGLELLDEAKAMLIQSAIQQNGMGGAWVAEKSVLEAENSVFAENPGPTLWIRDSARLKLWATEVRETKGPGMRVQDEATALLLGSSLIKNQDVGAEVLGNATFIAYGTVFQGNWDGLSVRGGTVQLQGCHFNENRWNGISARGDSTVVAEKTHFFRGQGAALSSSDSAMVELRECTIQGFLGPGVSGFSRFPVIGGDNEFWENGVDLLGNVQPELRRKRATPGLDFLRFPSPDFPDLQTAVDAVLPGGILEILAGSYVAGLTVDKPLEIRAQDEVTLRGVSSNAPVLSLVAGAKLRLVGGRITGGSEGLTLGAGAEAELTRCLIEENTAGIKLWQDAHLAAKNVQILRHPQGGIWLWDESMAELVEVTVSQNEMCGIGAGGQSSLFLQRSEVAENGWLGGVLLQDFARAELLENKFSANKGFGVALGIRACIGSGWGFQGKVVGKGNKFSGNYKGPVCPADLSFLED